MKTLFAAAIAVVTAALSATPSLAASDAANVPGNTGGHYEWRTQPSFGPKASAPSRTRVWVKDGEDRMASCDCAMMKANAAGCMMNMPGNRASRPAG